MSVLDFLRNRGGFYSLAEICAGTNMPADDVKRELERLEQQIEFREYEVKRAMVGCLATHPKYVARWNGLHQWRAK